MNNLQQLDEALDYLNEGIKDVIKGAPYGKNEFKRLDTNLLKKNKGNKAKKKIYTISHAKAVIRGTSTVDADLALLENNITSFQERRNKNAYF